MTPRRRPQWQSRLLRAARYVADQIEFRLRRWAEARMAGKRGDDRRADRERSATLPMGDHVLSAEVSAGLQHEAAYCDVLSRMLTLSLK